MVVVAVGVIMEGLVSLRTIMGVGLRIVLGVGVGVVVLTSPPPPLMIYLTVKEGARSLLPRLVTPLC